MDWMVCKLQVCKLVLIEFALLKKQQVNKHPKFDNNFDNQHQLEHFKYEMIHAYIYNVCSDFLAKPYYKRHFLKINELYLDFFKQDKLQRFLRDFQQ